MVNTRKTSLRASFGPLFLIQMAKTVNFACLKLLAISACGSESNTENVVVHLEGFTQG